MKFDDLIRTTDRAVFNTMALPATLNGAAIRLILDRAVVRTDGAGDITVNDYEVSTLNTEVDTIPKLSTFVVDGISYSYIGRVVDDGFITRSAVTRG
ncbi:MAG: hypothetical protein CME36_09695 [unclassified Hahellaceae]|nr:hypothetical protein [Hahellaceae bacterium]|tara:strand:- start:37696 stop:37986 length:291 start_codon:yes stop_codon:yes gene_type:complete